MPAKRKLVVVPQVVVNKKSRPSTAARPIPAVKVTPATRPKPPTGTSELIKKMDPLPPRLQDLPTSSGRSQWDPSTIVIKPNSRYEHACYPWDDYQDDIIVKSIEDDSLEELSGEMSGVQHYLHMLDRRPYTHICADFDEYRRHGASSPAHRDEDEDEDASEEDRAEDDGYTSLPNPVAKYTNPIYIANTRNPAIFLAITLIAQHNLKFLNLTSALNHIPNLSPSSAYLQLDDIVHTRYASRPTDISLALVFAPKFYSSDAHAIGFYEPSKLSGTCLFTPCSTMQLEEFGLIDWTSGPSTGNGKKKGVKAVGCRGGRWVKMDVVEEWEEWKAGVERVGRGWGRRVGKCKGV